MSEKTIRISVILFLLALLLRIFDIFVLRLDEILGEIILSKSLGLALVCGYVWWAGRKLSAVGFHRRMLGKALWIGGLSVGGLFALAYGVQLVLLNGGGQSAQLALSAVDPKTGMAGGVLFALWLIFGNLINAAMEEGLFRGVMLTHFRAKLSPWKALGLQAFFFAIWHLVWPAKHYFMSGASTGDALSESIGLLVATGIGGLTYGYLYYKTDNLWAAILAHFINNTVLNIVFIQTDIGLQSGVEFGAFLAIWLLGYLALIPIISWASKKYNLPNFTIWA